MKSTIFFVSSILCASAFAAPPSSSEVVKVMEISFGCNGSQPDLSQYGINFGFQTGEQRIPTSESRLTVVGSRIELASPNEERNVVVGVITSTPTCETSDSSFTKASWNTIQMNHQIRVIATMIPAPETCQELSSGYMYARQDQYQLSFQSPYLQNPQSFSWTTQRTFANLNDCKNN